LGAAFAEAAVHPLWYAFWAMGIAAALRTAFYRTRMMLYTFHGPNRTGEHARDHLHEAPPVMTGPLVVLGLLTVTGGALNAPELFGGHAFLEHWLEPVTIVAQRLRPVVDLASSTEWALVAGAVLVAAMGIFGEFRIIKTEALVQERPEMTEYGLATLH